VTLMALTAPGRFNLSPYHPLGFHTSVALESSYARLERPSRELEGTRQAFRRCCPICLKMH
jgi:alkylhydroperoxidase family enzyme